MARRAARTVVRGRPRRAPRRGSVRARGAAAPEARRRRPGCCRAIASTRTRAARGRNQTARYLRTAFCLCAAWRGRVFLNPPSKSRRHSSPARPTAPQAPRDQKRTGARSPLPGQGQRGPRGGLLRVGARAVLRARSRVAAHGGGPGGNRTTAFKVVMSLCAALSGLVPEHPVEISAKFEVNPTEWLVRAQATILGYLAKACAAQQKYKMAATMHERQLLIFDALMKTKRASRVDKASRGPRGESLGLSARPPRPPRRRNATAAAAAQRRRRNAAAAAPRRSFSPSPTSFRRRSALLELVSLYGLLDRRDEADRLRGEVEALTAGLTEPEAPPARPPPSASGRRTSRRLRDAFSSCAAWKRS